MAKQSLEERLAALEEDNKKIKIGAWWLRCLAYTIGGIVAAIAAFVQIIKDWPWK